MKPQQGEMLVSPECGMRGAPRKEYAAVRGTIVRPWVGGGAVIGGAAAGRRVAGFGGAAVGLWEGVLLLLPPTARQTILGQCIIKNLQNGFDGDESRQLEMCLR